MITDLTAKTLTELNAMTKAQLIASILEGQTDTTIEETKDGPHGQVHRAYVTRDRATGNLIKRVETTWTYHDDGTVCTITTTETDKSGKVLDKFAVRHHGDGANPELVNRKTLAIEALAEAEIKR